MKKVLMVASVLFSIALTAQAALACEGKDHGSSDKTPTSTETTPVTEE